METNCAVHLPPPPLPPPALWNRTPGVPPPRPQHAALPFMCDARRPVQETGDQPHDLEIQNTAAPPHPPEHDARPLGGQEDSESGDGKERHPVQETDPAPQAYENPQRSETTDHDGDVSGMDEEDIQPTGSV
ncbi:uncharacterized protein V3H82_000955 [Fundulus diaphanus]